MVMLHLCGSSLLREDDLLLELCLAYGVCGLLLLGRCLWGDWLWVWLRSGVCLHPGFLSLLVCLSVLGCLERLVLWSLWCSLTLICSGFSCHHVDLWGTKGVMVISHGCDGSQVGWLLPTVVSYPNSVCRCDHVGCICHILCVGR